ncbi:MAG: glycoside hydrolase family 57 protein [Candidatus Omnitrophota bacterium]|jgi:alpha-amylase/alpha-mannosidase (GH57 family)
MITKKNIEVAFLWHMHQPFYKDDLTGKYRMPWVRLHGVKDYYPMAALLEDFENVKVTFNMVPVLMEQLNDYVKNGATDVLLDLTLKDASSLAHKDKVQLLTHFFKINFKRFIEPNERYKELFAKKGNRSLTPSVVKRYDTEDLRDLQVLYNLAWFHSISIDEDTNLRDLVDKNRGYSEEDKEYVIFKQKEILSEILPLYKRLQDEGRIEISTTPYYHPILPLLCDTSIAGISSPEMELPRKRFCHPEDAKWHLEEAIKYYTEQFGRPPRGMWPSEGSVSDEALELMMSLGIEWAATDEDILFNSLSMYDKNYRGITCFDRRILYQPYKLKKDNKSINMIFRDKNLSDIISFNYNAWDQRDAAADLMDHFRKISEGLRRHTDRQLVTVIMDGENAWEYFEDNGRTFFETLYASLDKGDIVDSTTISGFLDKEPPKESISRIFPASWINHNFEVWIGQDQDNESWDYLSKVRKDLVKFTKELQKKGDNAQPVIQKAWREFHIAEGSDWNWWYTGKVRSGLENPFDELYRKHLMNIYKIFKQPIPEFLKKSIA